MASNLSFETVGSFSNFRLLTDGKKRNGKSDLATQFRANGLIKNRILSSLPDDDFKRLAPHLKLEALSVGKALATAGESSDYVYFPETAVISHLSDLADGNRVEIGMVGNEGATEICDILGLQPAMHRAEVLIEGYAWRIETIFIRQAMANCEKLQAGLLNCLEVYLAYVSQRVVCQSFHVVKERLCNWLLLLQNRTEQDQLKLTQEQLSQVLGVHRPTVSLVAHSMREEGLIDYVRGRLYILDRNRLESGACECYSTIQKGFPTVFHHKL